jgi:hypothetical protein
MAAALPWDNESKVQLKAVALPRDDESKVQQLRHPKASLVEKLGLAVE